MNDLPNYPDNPADSTGAASAASAATPNPDGYGVPRSGGLLDPRQRPMLIVVAVLAALLAAQAWSSHNRITNLRGEMARSLQRGDALNAETSTLARNLQDQSKELQVKVGVLENRQLEAQSQQLALEQLYQDLSKNRDEWALSEIEQVLSTASQQLQLAGNVQGALIALQNADRSLSRSDKPQFVLIRRAIAADIERLKELPAVDLAGVAFRLDGVIAQVDTLPLVSDEKPAQPDAPARRQPRGKAAKAATAPVPLTVGERLTQTWRQWSGEMWADVRDLIRVRTVETPEALLLSPSESFFVRENLKLRLLNARLALLSRNEGAFRDDLNSAQATLVKYFDTRARSTQSAQAMLRQVQGNNLAIEMPTLAGSLNAVRNYKAKS